ncbi:DUF1328 family protein [Rickettsiella massiliensis]
MLTWAFIFLIIAIIAAIFGYTGVFVAASGIAKTIFSFSLYSPLFRLLPRYFGKNIKSHSEHSRIDARIWSHTACITVIL